MSTTRSGDAVSLPRLAALIDLGSLQGFVDDFHRLTGAGVGIADADGRIVAAAGWEESCADFHRVDPETRERCIESDTILARGVPVGEFREYRCRRGLSVAATPIAAGDGQIGSAILGPFLPDDEEPDRQAIRARAAELGFDEERYLTALGRVPRWSHEKVAATMSVSARLARILSDLGHSRLMLEEAIDRVALQNAQMGLAQEMAGIGYWSQDFAEREVRWSETMYALFEGDAARGPLTREGHRDAIHPDDRAIFDEASRAIRAGQPADVVVRVPLRDGGIRFVQTRCRPQYRPDGTVMGVFGTSQDVTEQRQRQETIERDLAVSQAVSALYRAITRESVTIVEIAQVVLEQARQLTGSLHGFVSEVDPHTGENVGHTLTAMMEKECAITESERRIAFRPAADGCFRGLFGISLNDRLPFLCNDPTSHPRSVGTPHGHVALRRLLSVPVMLGETLVGEIAVANAARDYDARDVDALQRVAEAYALAIRHNRMNERERAHLAAVETSAGLATALVAAMDETEIWGLVCRAIHGLLPDTRVVTLLMDDAGQHLAIVDACGFDAKLSRLTALLGRQPKALRFPLSQLTDAQLATLRSGRLTTVAGGLASLGLGIVSRAALGKIVRLLHAGSVQVMGISTDERLMGALALLLPEGGSLGVHGEVVEMMVHQAGTALQRVSATVALRESQWSLARAQKVGRIGSWVWEPDADRLSWSEEMYEIFGVPSDFPLEFGAIEAMIHPDDRPRNTAEVGRMLGGTDEVEYELRLLRPDGEVTSVLQRVEVERDDGDAPRRLFGIIQDMTELKRSEAEVRRVAGRLRRALEATADAMGVLVETRDPYTAGHERRVAALAEAIARRLGLDPAAVTGVRVAGSMHDIGKISVPAEILSKPTHLTDMEMELVKRHAEIGHGILQGIDFEWPVAEIVLEHHERLDGSGYPRHLRGDEIRGEARILAVADVVEAMSSHRPYRPALGPEAALAEIRAGRGSLYDETVVDACLAVLEEDGFVFPD